MLKDSEALNKRRKLALSHGIAATPPITPPTLPLNMMLSKVNTTCSLTNTATSPTVLANATTPLSPTAMAAALLTSVTSTPQQLSSAPATSHMAGTTVTSAGVGGSAQDHYSLRWNNHQIHILRAFDTQLQTKTLVDVTLVCAETSISAHKMVLSACSPFFQRVFAETPCKHPVIVLKDFQGWLVQAIVDFMYRGEISVPQERLQTLIQAGESLQVRGLVESSVPEHTPTPAASPDDFGMIDTSLMSSELERCSSFDEESPSMVTAGSKLICPSRLFGAARRDRRGRERQRERKRERELERDLERAETESDPELPHESGIHSDICTSPMPRRKQARPRRRSGDLPHELQLPSQPATPTHATHTETNELNSSTEKAVTDMSDMEEAIKTVIKKELSEPADEDDAEGAGERDSGNGNDSHENIETAEKSHYADEEQERADSRLTLDRNQPEDNEPHTMDEEEDDEHAEHDDNDNDAEAEPEDIEELINTTNELRRKSYSALSDGPEDLCTTKKDNDTSGHHSASDNESNPANNNNNSKLNNNNNRIVLSLKDIRHLNKPSASTPNSNNNNMNPFAATSLRDLRLDRAANALENQCKMEALEAQMHAAALAAAAANGENPFHHMEHQMAAAAAAAVQTREHDQAMQREQRELQQQHNAYANSILGQMVMPPMPPFGPAGPVGPGGGQAAHERLEESMNRLSKEFGPTSPMSLPTHYNPADGQPHPPSPLPFGAMSTLTPPHMFGLDSPLGLFPPNIDPSKLYNPLIDMPDPRGMGDPPPYLKKKMPRPKGQHSAPRGGPPRSWTNAELTEALQHVWNKKMTTSQASRIFGIPYNSLLMYVRGKYGKSLKLEQLRKDCISGPPLELLQMGISGSSGGGGSSNSKNNNNNSEARESRKEQRERERANNSADMDMGMPLPGGGPRSASSEPDLLGGHNALFNPFPPGFYPDFPGGFPGLPLGMLNLLPPTERHQHAAANMHHMSMDEDCKSDRSKHSSLDEDFCGGGNNGGGLQPLALSRGEEQQRRSASATGELLSGAANNNCGGATPTTAPTGCSAATQQNGGAQD